VFRPNAAHGRRSTTSAKWVTYGYDKVIDLDVKSYFDTIGTWSNGACAMRACCG
jgi:hypothetical protein